MNTAMTRRAVLLAAASTLATGASAQEYPSRPIKIIVGFAVGGSADAISRLYAQKMSELLKTPIIVENKPGAGQLLAIRTVLSSPPDGYTLFFGSGSALAQGPALRKVPYDPVKDFTYIGLLEAQTGVVIVNKELPVKSIKELIDYSKANPGTLNYGSTGVGAAGHLAVEVLMQATGMKLTQIQYKADAEVIRDMIAGHVHVAIMPTLNTVAQIRAGNIRALAVTEAKRLPYLPDVPSLTETGIKALADLEPHAFHSLVGPAGLPADVVSKVNAAINKVAAEPELLDTLRNHMYCEPINGSPAAMHAFMARELAKWTELGKTVKLPD